MKMIRIFKRVTVIALALALVVTALASCGGAGAFSDDERTVMTLSDYKVTYDEYRYFYYNCMLDMGEDFDYRDDSQMETLKKNVESALRKRYAIKQLCEKYKRTLSKAEKKEMDAFIEEYITDLGGKDKYKQALRERRMTGDVFRDQYALTYYYDVKLRDLLFTGYDNVIPVDDKTVKQDVLDNFYHYTQIFIPFNSGSNYVENQAYAEEALGKLKAGESFDEVAAKYSQWTVDFRVGVYSTYGEKLEMIEKTALELEEGQFSDVIFTSEGHHIIKRLPLEEEYIDKNLDTLLTVSATRRYNEMLDKVASELTVEYKPLYSELLHGLLVTRTDG